MKRQHIWRIVAILLCILLLVNLLAGRGHERLVDAARARCLAEGYPVQDMKLLGFQFDDGRFGFGGHGTVDFGPDPSDSSRILRVELRKRINVLGWKVDSIAWHHS